MSDLGKHIWSEDTDLFTDPVTIHDKWKELYGEAFDSRRAYRLDHRPGHIVFRMMGGRLAVNDDNGWHIYEATNESQNS